MESPRRVLVIDDEPNLLQMLARALKKRGYEVLAFTRPREAMASLAAFRPEIVLSDIVMKEMDGIEVLKQVKESDPETNVILITAHASLESAIGAIRGGASDYLVKPFKIEELSLAVQRALSSKRLFFASSVKEQEYERRYEFKNLLGESAKMREIRNLVGRISETESTVLITGESGTGKELVARSIHYNSRRKEKPFVSINCAALPEPLLESELFGHEKGSFTGAVTTKAGLIELASEGTFFFDEIGEAASSVQAKLLRVLQERELRHVGGLKDIRVNVRVIAASSRDLAREAAEKKFREDLYYRLNVVPIHMPALRERREDVPMLMCHFLEFYRTKLGAGKKVRISGEAMEFLQSEYPWPGNIRELENLSERILMLSDKEEVILPDLRQWLDVTRGGKAALQMGAGIRTEEGVEPDLKSQTEAFEKKLIADAIRQTAGNKFKAAKLLKISRQSLQYKLKKYDIEK